MSRLVFTSVIAPLCPPPDVNGATPVVVAPVVPGQGVDTLLHPLQRAYLTWRNVARKVVTERAPFAVQCRAGMREQRALKRCIAAGLEVPQ